MAADGVDVRVLLLDVVDDVLEAVVVIGNGGEVRLEVGSGHGVGCGFGYEGREFGRGDGGGGGPPADPRGGVGGIGVVEDGGEALAGIRVGYGIGSAVGPSGSGRLGVHDYHFLIRTMAVAVAAVVA